VRFARGFRGKRGVVAFPLPGFAEGERLPASMEAATAVHAESIQRFVGNAPFVLAGHSSGGLLAYAVAGHLEQLGLDPVGVAMVDAYPLDNAADTESFRAIVDGMLARDGAYLQISDTRLTAMGAYLRMLAGWQPERISAPNLLLRATEGIADGAHADDGPAMWKLSDDVAEVAGNHFTIMEDHAEATARTVEDWLATMYDEQEVS
jgi:thioesterase domain-containing protein